MTVRSESLTRRHISWNRLAAVVAWLGGVATTYLFFARAMPEMAWFVNLALAGTAQWLLTMGERPLWRRLLGRKGGRAASLAFVVTLGDGLLNAAGLYPYMNRLGATDLGKMLSDVLNVQSQMDARAAFGIALFLGLIVAALPEFLWEAD